jgi:hypothetical protein
LAQFVFSALYNETSEYFEVFINNFLHYTGDDCILIVNMSAASSVPAHYDCPPRIFLIEAEVVREKWGSTLLAGHIQSFRYAEIVSPNFEFFIPIASNSLFFRSFDGVLALDALTSSGVRLPPTVSWGSLPQSWHWPHFLGFQANGETLRNKWGIDGLWMSQIEGLLASRADWSLIAEIFFDLKDCWNGLKAPLEEVLPATVIRSIGSGKITFICKVKWDQMSLGLHLVNLEDITNMDKLPRQVVLMKWFPRDPIAKETLFVGTPIGQTLLNAMQAVEPGSMADELIETLLHNFLLLIKARAKKSFALYHGKMDTLLSPQSLNMVADRSTCGVDGEARRPDAPFIFLENTLDRVCITTHASAEGDLKINCTVSTENETQVISESLQAYLYLPVPQASVLYLSGSTNGISVERLVRHVVWHDTKFDYLHLRSYSIVGDCFEARYRLPRFTNNCFLGLPIWNGQNLQLRLMVGNV